jgi:hypothetical protein
MAPMRPRKRVAFERFPVDVALSESSLIQAEFDRLGGCL